MKAKYKNILECVESHTGMTEKELLSEHDLEVVNAKEAKDMIIAAMDADRHIFVMADYDVDGVMSGCIFHQLFEETGYINYTIRFPKRFTEGYGIRPQVVDEVIDNSLIITVDNGIRAIEAIGKAKNRGLQVVIIDHHLPDHILPEADVIVNPHVTGGDFDGYCGAGLAYKVCRDLVKNTGRMIAYAAVATIADMVPLLWENRTIVQKGLRSLDCVPPGMQHLLALLDMQGFATETDVSFRLGPSINAMSRMNDDGARMAFETLECRGPEAEELALQMKETNEERKKIQREARKKVVIEKKHIPMCVYLPDISEGIIGILAGELASDYRRPVLVFTNNGDILKGSGRSYGNVNLHDLLQDVDDLLLAWGGHEGAAGMSILPQFLPQLQKRLTKAFFKNGLVIQYEKDTCDIQVKGNQLFFIFEELDKYRPYGVGNPAPKLFIERFELKKPPFAEAHYRFMGGDDQHLKLFGKYNVIGFDMAKKYQEAGLPQTIDLLAAAQKDHYFNKKGELVIKDSLEMIDF